MLQRFLAASGVASVAISLGSIALLLAPTFSLQRTYPLLMVWCFVPLAWGVWALIAPAAWIPKLLPIWGAILGVIAGSLAAFVLNLPSRILGETIPVTVRGLGVIVMAVLYYLLWMVVRVVCRCLITPKA